jgi:TonB-dependent starch-binding outer membrane protein SusC
MPLNKHIMKQIYTRKTITNSPGQLISKMGKPLLRGIICLMLLFPLTVSAQDQTIPISGRVVDTDNAPLVGVTIMVVGTSSGTVTDMDGNYSLNAAPNATLRFTYIGFRPVEANVGGRNVINIVMEYGMSGLEEIVVIGYGTQRKQDLTGAITVVDIGEAQKLTTGSISEMLQGQAAGVAIFSSGDPGSMGRINIRGYGSFSEVGPLFVVDGLIVNDVNHINPADIESVQILKDASSTAIYGSRGANGVIIMTTRRAKSGKPTFEVTATTGLQELSRKIPMMNTLEYLHYNELSYLNAGMPWPANATPDSYLPNTDFQNGIFRVGTVQDYNVSYLQGTDNTSFMTGGGFFSQDGVLEGPNYNRFTYRVNSEGNFGILTVGENLTFSRASRKITNFNTSSFTNALIMPPVLPIYDPSEPSGKGGFGYGSIYYPTYSTNPVAQQQTINHNAIDNRVLGNVYTHLKIFDVFTYKANLGMDYWFGRQKIINHAYTMRMGSAEQRYDNILNDIRDERLTIIAENTLNYNQTFGKHVVEALAGLTYQNDKWYYLRNEGYNQKVDGLWQIDLVGEQNNMWGSEQEHRIISYLGRINYNFDNRYLLQGNFRSDASSRFGPDRRRGYFPSGSFGWRISQESFMENTREVVDDLKFRVSYGKIGDMQALGNYDYIADIDNSGPYEGFFSIFGPSGNESVNSGALQSGSVNPLLGWETKTTFNIGLDYTLFRDRFYGTADYFDSKSTDLLIYLPQAWATGVSNRWTNYGQMRNQGIEFSLGWRDKVGEFSYNISSNFYTVRNEVLDLGELYREGGWNNVNRTEKGRSIGDFFLIETNGIFQSMDEVFEHTTTLEDGTVMLIQARAQPGDIRYVDYNNDGQIDLDDRQWMGSPLPKYLVGLNFSSAWRGIDFTMFWTASYGNKIFNVQRYELLKFDVDNIPADVTPWTWDNPSSIYPRPYASASDNRRAQTDRYLEDGSYLRLKNIQLGYSLPRTLMGRNLAGQMRIYIGAQNLLTITEYKGYDPELLVFSVFGQGNDFGGYPPVRSFNLGLQLTF